MYLNPDPVEVHTWFLCLNILLILTRLSPPHFKKTLFIERSFVLWNVPCSGLGWFAFSWYHFIFLLSSIFLTSVQVDLQTWLDSCSMWILHRWHIVLPVSHTWTWMTFSLFVSLWGYSCSGFRCCRPAQERAPQGLSPMVLATNEGHCPSPFKSSFILYLLARNILRKNLLSSNIWFPGNKVI